MKQILFLIAISVTNLIYCQQGFIDNSFGNNGFVPGKLPGMVNTIIQQQDGKLLAAGSFFDFNCAVIRMLNNGILDSSFGINGAAIGNPAGGGYDMLLTVNKKILIVGSYVDENNVAQYFVERFTTDGKPDSSFGVNGTTVIPKAHRADAYTEIALNEDGSIIVGGFGTNSVITLDSQYSIISKLSVDGGFDNKFGGNGYILNLTSLNMQDIVVQPDGKIVTAGYNFGFDFVFSRYNTDGSLDKNFGNDGNETFIVGGNDEPQKIIMQANGKLMIGGFTSLNGGKMCALRLNANGSLDETFGDSGKVLVDFQDGDSYAYDMVQQPDGKFILAGGASDLKETGSSFALCRINNDGKLDSSFGINGLQTTAYSDFAQAYCAALQSDGKIILGGIYQKKNENASYLMIRYNNDISKKQIIITKIKKWIQHHNGFTWDNNSNISNYEVQRSYDGIHWKAVSGKQRAMSNSSVHYYADPSPLSGTNYYRLQTTNTNGSVNYSNVIAVTNSDIKISPNPAKNVLQIQGLASNQKIKITVVDFAGNEKLQAVANTTSYNLNIASLKPGNYLLRIESDDDVVTKKFVKE